MLNELQSWWQGIDAPTRALVWDGAVALGALLGGLLLGVLATRTLRGWRLDSVFRVSPAPEKPEDAERRFSPAAFGGFLVRLSAWAAAAWWLAARHGRPDIADTLAFTVGRTWLVVGALGGALALAGLLARRVVECLDGAAPPEHSGSRPGGGPRRGVAGAAGAGTYVVVLILTLLAVVDQFDWPLTRGAAVGLWQLAQHLLIAGAAVAVGVFGARQARELCTSHATASPADHAGQYTAVGLVGGTTALAVALLLFGSGLSIGVGTIVIVAVVAVLAYLWWKHLPDLLAGLKLRRNGVTTVWKDGTAWQVARIGLFRSDVGRNGEYFSIQNRQLLDAAAQGAPEAARHSELMR